ncbi:cytochrome P450 [Ustulina deusta]|nr:cytochrome P450 [Ustulina deusta]
MLSFFELFSSSSLYFLVTCALTYCVVDTLRAHAVIRKQANIPVAGGLSIPTPRFFTNLLFAWRAADILERGYRKFTNRPFQLVREDGGVLVLPSSMLEELAALPDRVATAHGALEHDLLGRYTGLDIVLKTRLHHTIVQRRLTTRLKDVIPNMEKALTTAFNDWFPKPKNDNWTNFQPYQDISKIMARFTAEVLVSPEFSDNPVWLEIAVQYTENLFRTIVILRLFPSWLHPIICWFVPSWWRVQSYIKSSKQLLGPRVKELLEMNDNGTWAPQLDEKGDLNIMAWLIGTVKGPERNADRLAHVQVVTALASVHTTMLRIVNVLYDIHSAGPGLVDELRAEIEDVATAQKNWTDSAYDHLHKLDSVLRESQRLSPPTTLGLKRLFREPWTFKNGLHVEPGTYVCLPVYAIENDPERVPDPARFDGLRHYRQAMNAKGDNNGNNKASSGDDFRFSTPSPTSLSFGYGKAACPGRFFASVAIKMVFVKLLSEYEFRFVPEDVGDGTQRVAQRPRNYMVHEFLFPWPWDWLQMRRRNGGICPL